MNDTLQTWMSRPIADRSLALADVAIAARETSKSHGVYIHVEENPVGAEGELAGIPFAVKDNIDVTGIPTTGGSPVFEGFTAPVDAGVVSVLRAAGAAVIGKTNLHELAFGVTSNNGRFGPVRNPVDPTRTSGGSSGGSAATVALGTVPFALGTDTGGSMTVPASFCGVVGYRPTTGRYPGDGLINLSWTRDTVGIHANVVADVRTVDRIITGARHASVPVPDSGRGIRLGVPARYFDSLDDEVARVGALALETLARSGVVLVEGEVAEGIELADQAGFGIVFYECARTLSARIASHPGGGTGMTFADLVEGCGSTDVQRILQSVSDSPVSDTTYQNLLKLRWQLRRAYQNAFAELSVDAFIFPSVPVLPPLIGNDETLDFKGTPVPVFPTITRNAGPGTLAGVPMISIPVGAAGSVLPVGMTLEGAFHDDPHLLALADFVQGTFDSE